MTTYTLTTRAGKGSRLSVTEGDNNLNAMLRKIGDISTLRTTSPENGVRVLLECHTSAGDGGHGIFRGVTGAAAGTYTHDGANVVVPSGGDGAEAWIREGLTLAYVPNSTATASSAMGVEYKYEDSTYPIEDEGGIWSAETYAHIGINKEFTSDYAASPAGSSPTTTFFVFTNNNNAPGDVVGFISDAVARTANDVVFAANFIARNAAVNGTKLVGLEIDVEPAAGTTIDTGSAGLLLNVFSISATAPAVQVGGISGTWENGIILDKIRGAGLAAQSGSTGMDSLVNTSTGTYDDAAIVLGEGANTTGVKFSVNGGRIYVDSSGNYRLVIPTSKIFAFRNPGDTASVVSIDTSGAVTIGTLKDQNGLTLLTTRKTGWSTATGTATRTTFDTATVTTEELARRVKALIDDLHNTAGHGIIGT